MTTRRKLGHVARWTFMAALLMAAGYGLFEFGPTVHAAPIIFLES